MPLNFKNVKINYEPEYFTSNPVIDSQNVYTLTPVSYTHLADLEAIEDSGKYSNLFTLRSMLFSMYDGELDDEKLLEGAMKGMAEAVGDPYTVYMLSLIHILLL